MASFRCYDNSDVIATLIITNFHLYLIQLWWYFFQIFVYGDEVYTQTSQRSQEPVGVEPIFAFMYDKRGPRGNGGWGGGYTISMHVGKRASRSNPNER